MTLDIIRDSLGNELTSDTLACNLKADHLARALYLTCMLHLTPSFDAAIKFTGFYEVEMLQVSRRMTASRTLRSDQCKAEGVPPPPVRHQPGLEDATSAPGVSSRTPAQNQMTVDSIIFGTSFADSAQFYDFLWSSPGKKQKRTQKTSLCERPVYLVLTLAQSDARLELTQHSLHGCHLHKLVRSNLFTGKSPANNNCNPFANRSVHKPASESFFVKVERCWS
ncbi:hypothetical protein C8Q74DRAFT_1374152 [Fomes fomentarius]|nr:hypothetical protein C8Q74DRAFT_1374139 [Fomes fomentarius]KAI0749058.1 hypothetical protein C8Q74DRAFT_1374152 [Fomes fomentarius]